MSFCLLILADVHQYRSNPTNPENSCPSQGHQDRPRSRVVAQRLGIAGRGRAAVTRPHNVQPVDLVPLIGVSPGTALVLTEPSSSLMVGKRSSKLAPLVEVSPTADGRDENVVQT